MAHKLPQKNAPRKRGQGYLSKEETIALFLLANADPRILKDVTDEEIEQVRRKLRILGSGN